VTTGNALVAAGSGGPYLLLMQTISEQTVGYASKVLARTMPGQIGQTNEIKGEFPVAISNKHVKSLRSRRQAAGLTTRGLPKGYRKNPALLAKLPDEPKRGVSSRNPLNWLEKKCLFCGQLIISNKRHQKFCSRPCRFSYEFQQKQRLPGVNG